MLVDGEAVDCVYGFGPASAMDHAGAVVATEPRCAESTLTNPLDLRGKLALTHRGECDYLAKANRAAEAGAVALIIVNNVPGDAIHTPDDGGKYTGGKHTSGKHASSKHTSDKTLGGHVVRIWFA